MERIEWKGDFLGFTFGGIHSSSLGIVRTSDGSRYNENLLPEFEDKTVKVPGRDETYYFGSEYKQRIFEIKIAFDNMTDKQFRQLRQLMSGQELKDLIFDEVPYKVYKVKANGTPNLSYIAFDEEYRRIYRGEGTLSFIAYFPFARSRFKYREDYIPKNIPEWGGIQDNKMSWLESSGIPSKNKIYNITLPAFTTEGGYDQKARTFSHTIDDVTYSVERSTQGLILKNVGDITTPLQFTLESGPYNGSILDYYIYLRKINISDTITFDYNDEPIAKMKISIPHNNLIDGWVPIGAGDKCFITFDGYSNLVTAYRIVNNEKIYASEPKNNIIVQGDFIKLPVVNDNELLLLHIDQATDTDQYKNNAVFKSINYDYLYY